MSDYYVLDEASVDFNKPLTSRISSIEFQSGIPQILQNLIRKDIERRKENEGVLVRTPMYIELDELCYVRYKLVLNHFRGYTDYIVYDVDILRIDDKLTSAIESKLLEWE